MDLPCTKDCSLADLLSTLGVPSPCTTDLYQVIITLLLNALVEGSGINIDREGNKAVISLIDGLIQGGPGVTVVQNPDGTYTISVDVVPPPLVFGDSSTIDVDGSGTVGDPYVFSLDPGAISAGVGISITVNPDDTLTISSPIIAGAGIALVSNPDGSYTISATATQPTLADSPTIDVTGTGTPGDPYTFNFAAGSLVAGPGIGIAQAPSGVFTISNTAAAPLFGDSATNVLGGTGVLGDPYTFTFAPNSLVAGPGIVLAQAPNGVFTISAPLVLLQFWAEQYNAAQDITSWNAVNNSVAGFRNVVGLLLNRVILAAAGPVLGADSVDLHQGALATQTASGANSGILAGLNNTVAGATSTIAAGSGNLIRAAASTSFIGGGSTNDIGLTVATNGGILAGTGNEIRGNNGGIVAGQDNSAGLANGTADGFRSLIGAGTLNEVRARDSGVFTGVGNDVIGTPANANDGANAIVTGTTNLIVTLAPAAVAVCAILCGRLNTIGDAGVATSVTASSIISGQNIVMVASNTYNPPLAAAATSASVPQQREINGSSAGGSRVRMSASHSFAMGHALLVDEEAHSSFTTGSYLHNTLPHSTLVGRHGSSPSTLEPGSLSVCSGSYNDPSVSVQMGRDSNGGGMVISDSMRLSGETVSYFFPKNASFASSQGEDVGLFVTLNGDGSVSPTQEGDEIFGVTVPRQGLMLNSQDHHWHGKYLKDEFGTFQMRESYVDSFLDLLSQLREKDTFSTPDNTESSPERKTDNKKDLEAYKAHEKTKQRAWDAIHSHLGVHDDVNLVEWAIYNYAPMWPALKALSGVTLKARKVPVINPSYDAARPYIPRSERDEEWVPIVTKGLARVKMQGSAQIGSLCAAKDGLAVPVSQKGLKIVGRVSPTVVTVLL